MTLRKRLALTILVAAVPLCVLLLAYQGAVRRRAQVEALRDMALSMMQLGGRQIAEAFPDRFPMHPGGGAFEVSDADVERLIPLLGSLASSLSGKPTARVEPGTPMGDESQGAGEREAGAPPPPMIDAPRAIPVVSGSVEMKPPASLENEVEMWAYHRDFHSSNKAAPPFPPALRRAIEAGAEYADDETEVSGKDAMRVAVAMPWKEGPAALMLVTAPMPPPEADAGVLRWGLVGLCVALVATMWIAAGPIVGRIRRLQGGVREAAATGYAKDVEVRGRDELAELARAFNEAGAQVRRHVAEVEEREQTLRRFVADTTHDVMIPLTVLQGHLSDVRDHLRRGEDVPDDTVRMSLEEAHYLGSLLQNLSAVAKLEGGEPEHRRDPVDVGRLVERVVERHRALARARGITLDHAIPTAAVVARGDVTLLEQAVNNVVHNAIRHNDDGGHVAVVLDRTGDRFALRVLDDGPGVAEADLPRLGTRRFRSDAARTRDPAGRGLGLHIARRVAERHGFGLTFRVVVPRGLEAAIEGPVDDTPVP